MSDRAFASTSQKEWLWTEEVSTWPAVMPNGQPWPRVSIVTPSLNQARYLEATIRSVLLQGYPNLEYLIIDGGSTDGSIEVIRRYAQRLSYWVSEPDAGQADAIDKGWQRAGGAIFAYLNSDDLYLPGTIRRIVECFEASPDTGVVYGACQLIDGEGRFLGRPVRFPKVSFNWLLRYPLTQPAVFLRRGVWKSVEGLDTSLQYVFDWDFFLRILRMGTRFRQLDGPPLACFRCWDGQKTASHFERQIAEQLRIRDRLLLGPSVSPVLAREIQFSKAWVFLWPAYQAYRSGDVRTARILLRRAVQVNSRIVGHRAFADLYIRTWLGRRLSRALRHAKARIEAAIWPSA